MMYLTCTMQMVTLGHGPSRTINAEDAELQQGTNGRHFFWRHSGVSSPRKPSPAAADVEPLRGGQRDCHLLGVASATSCGRVSDRMSLPRESPLAVLMSFVTLRGLFST